MNALSVQIVGPSRVELREVPLREPGPGEVVVRSEVSALSAGSERLVYSGALEAGVSLDESLPSLSGSSRYPVAYGYCSVGRVERLGPGVPPSLEGARVFAFHPHQSRFVAVAEGLIVLPHGITAEAGSLLANTETAVSLVMDAAPILGEVSVVLGLGIVGQLVLGITSRLLLGPVIGVDPRDDRRDLASRVSPMSKLMAQAPESVADLVYEVSGVLSALEASFVAARREGRIIVGSWYGSREASIALGTRAHRNRNTVRFSQVSRLDSALTGRFDHRRRMELALDWLGRLPVTQLITHRIPFADAVKAWELLERPPQGCLQILLTHD